MYDTGEKIIALQDELSEEIIFDAIESQMENVNTAFSNRFNYVTSFKDKYETITPDDDFYDQEYINESVRHLINIVADGLKENYKVELADDPEFLDNKTMLDDYDTLYEFLYCR